MTPSSPNPGRVRARVLGLFAFGLTTCLIFSVVQSPASASQDPDGLEGQISKAVDFASAPTSVADGRVAIPQKGDTVASLNGPEHKITLSIPAQAEGEVLSDEVTTRFDGTDSNTSVMLQPLDSGVRALIDIQSADAPESYDFELGADVAGLKLQDDGSVIVVDKAGVEFAQVDAPWAFDASGAKVPTHFEVNGTILTQVVQHRGGDWAYGIIADPSVWWWTKNIATCAAQVASVAVPGKAAQVAAKIAKAAKSNKKIKKAKAEIKALGGFVSAMKKIGTYARTKGKGLSAMNKKRVQNLFAYGGSTLVEIIGLGGCYTIYKEVRK